MITSKYYNFVENYLHSTGRGRRTLQGPNSASLQDLFEEECNFGLGDKIPPPDSKCTLQHDLFTSPHMMMTAAYAMFEQAEKVGGDISQVDPESRDFRARAIRAADTFTRVYPEGYAEQAASGEGTVVLNLFDTNVNGFGCYWWTNTSSLSIQLNMVASSFVQRRKYQGTGYWRRIEPVLEFGELHSRQIPFSVWQQARMGGCAPGRHSQYDCFGKVDRAGAS